MPRLNYHYEVLHNDENAKLFTYLVVIFNFLYAILGAIMIAAGFYITLDDSFREYMDDLDMDKYLIGVYILIVAGVIVMVQSFFGICGAYLKKSKMLQTFFLMTVVSFVLEIAGASYLIANGTKGSKLEVHLETTMYDILATYTYDTSSKRSMDTIQTWIGCCGVMGIADYVKWNMVIPSSCYDPITGNAWYRKGIGYLGCVQAFTIHIAKGTGWICGVALLLAFFQIFGMICSCCLLSIKKDFRSKSIGDLTSH